MPPVLTETPPPDADVPEQLGRILGSQSFQKADQLRKLLKFVVEETLAGCKDKLDERYVAVGAFGRVETTFNPPEDPIARAAKNKLRDKLEKYYHTEGRGDPITIEIPKGGYVPEFSWRSSPIARSPQHLKLKLLFAIARNAMGMTGLMLIGWGLYTAFPLHRLPADTLVVGLAVFSPDSSTAQYLRSRIKLALENREDGGPKLEVQLLDGQLDASHSDLLRQAKALSHNRVHVVIGATALEEHAFLPRVVIVRPFGSLRPGNALEIILDQLKLKLDTNEATGMYRTAALPVSDLVKILYAVQYFSSLQSEKMELALRDLHDEQLGAALTAEMLTRLADRGPRDEAVHRLKKALEILGPVIGASPERACLAEAGEGALGTCKALIVRAHSYVQLALMVGTVQRIAYIGRALLDYGYAYDFFRRNSNQSLAQQIRERRAELYRLLGNATGIASDRKRWFLRSKQDLEDLLRNITKYGESDAWLEANIRRGFADALISLADESDKVEEFGPEAVKQLSQSLQGCAEDVPPGRESLLQVAKSYWDGSVCPLDEVAWAEVKASQLRAFGMLTGSAIDDGTYAEDALDSFRNSLKVLSENREPVIWAGCNRMLAMTLIRASTASSTLSKKHDQLQRALVAIQDAFKVYSRDEFPRPWALTQLTLAAAQLHLSDLSLNEPVRQAYRQKAQDSLLAAKYVLGDEAPSDLAALQ